MSLQRRLIPSTSMLLAFDASARTGSFTQAAKELHLTQGAISRQVAALEDQLDVILFERHGKTIELTDTGKTYAREVHTILQSLRSATLNAITNPLNGILNLGILPTFGTKWLMPRLPDFLKQHPDITVNFTTKLTPFELKQEDVHAAIHFGLPDWPDSTATYLMGEQIIPICSPGYFKQHKPRTAADFADLTLLHIASRPHAWRDWFAAQEQTFNNPPGMLFEQFSILTQAAVVGLGAALLPKFLIQNELERGELIQLLPTSSTPASTDDDGPAYYLMSTEDRKNYAPLKAFRAWLIDVCAES